MVVSGGCGGGWRGVIRLAISQASAGESCVEGAVSLTGYACGMGGSKGGWWGCYRNTVQSDVVIPEHALNVVCLVLLKTLGSGTQAASSSATLLHPLRLLRHCHCLPPSPSTLICIGTAGCVFRHTGDILVSKPCPPPPPPPSPPQPRHPPPGSPPLCINMNTTAQYECHRFRFFSRTSYVPHMLPTY